MAKISVTLLIVINVLPRPLFAAKTKGSFVLVVKHLNYKE